MILPNKTHIEDITETLEWLCRKKRIQEQKTELTKDECAYLLSKAVAITLPSSIVINAQSEGKESLALLVTFTMEKVMRLLKKRTSHTNLLN